MTWALRSLCRPSRRAHLPTTRKRVVVLPAAVVRSPRGGPPGVPSLPSMDRPADATGGLCIGRGCADAPGVWGPSTPNKLRRVYTGALLATMVTPPKKGGDRPMRRPTPKLQWEGTGLTRHCLSYPRSFWQTVSQPSHCGVRFAQVEKRTTTHTRVTKQAEWQWAAAGAG